MCKGVCVRVCVIMGVGKVMCVCGCVRVCVCIYMGEYV